MMAVRYHLPDIIGYIFENTDDYTDDILTDINNKTARDIAILESVLYANTQESPVMDNILDLFNSRRINVINDDDDNSSMISASTIDSDVPEVESDDDMLGGYKRIKTKKYSRKKKAKKQLKVKSSKRRSKH